MDDWQKIKTSNNKVHGFTLIELLAAAAIVGVLVTLAMPRYKAFVARSRQAEAKENLGTMYKLQEAYYYHTASLGTAKYHPVGIVYGGATGKCGSSQAEGGNLLGFRLNDCSKSRYTYTTFTTYDGAAGGTAAPFFIYPDCVERDEWNMSRAGSLQNQQDVVSLCTD